MLEIYGMDRRTKVGSQVRSLTSVGFEYWSQTYPQLLVDLGSKANG